MNAPDDGIIFERNAVIGALVNGSDPLFRMARHGEIELEAMVPEALISAIGPSQPVSVTLSGEAIRASSPPSRRAESPASPDSRTRALLTKANPGATKL